MKFDLYQNFIRVSLINSEEMDEIIRFAEKLNCTYDISTEGILQINGDCDDLYRILYWITITFIENEKEII